MLAILDVPVSVASDLVTTLSHGVEPVFGDGATAGAIVLVTLAVRLLLVPLSYRAARAARARVAMRPKELALRQRFRNSPARLRQALYDLHRRHQTSRFAGVAPLLAQLPFFMVLYRLFLSPTVNGQANVLLTHTLLGVPLGDRWIADLASGLLPPDLLVFGTVFVLLTIVAWWSSRQARQAMALALPTTAGPAASSTASSTAAPTTVPGNVDAEIANRVQGVMSRLVRLAPYGTVLAAAFVPLAAGLYLLTTTAWSAAERFAFGTYRAPATAR